MSAGAADRPIAVFAYGSLVDRASAEHTLGHPLGEIHAARLPGWRRRFSQARDNHRSEKTFAAADGSIPPFVLGLNLEPDPTGAEATAPNGALIEVSAADLELLDRRELRYDRADVSADVHGPGSDRFARVIAYVAKPEQLALRPPPGAVILAAYARTVEVAFERRSKAEGELYRRTTLPYPAPLLEGGLVADRIPPGNPRRW